jgi:mannose-6-phosphate isomerase-like protein (cupin superfamily)
VLLLRCAFAAHRKNGRRRIYATADDAGPRRVDLSSETEACGVPFTFRTIAHVEETCVQVAYGEGTWPVDVPAPADLMLFVSEGSATVRTADDMVHMHRGDVTAVPIGTVYHLSTTKGTSLVRVTR